MTPLGLRMAVRAGGSKADCLVLEIDYAKERPNDWTKHVLRHARIRARKLVLLAKNSSLESVLADLRALSSDNMDFPVRLYNDVDVDYVIKVEGCSTYEVKTLDSIINLGARV